MKELFLFIFSVLLLSVCLFACKKNSEQANFTYDGNLWVLNNITFSSNATIDSPNVQWIFGDGTSSIQKSPVHSYIQTGTYAVSLILNKDNAHPITKLLNIKLGLERFAKIWHFNHGEKFWGPSTHVIINDTDINISLVNDSTLNICGAYLSQDTQSIYFYFTNEHTGVIPYITFDDTSPTPMLTIGMRDSLLTFW